KAKLMNLHFIDAGIVIFYLIMVVAIGIYTERRAGKNIESYFLGESKMSWWLLGMSGSSTYLPCGWFRFFMFWVCAAYGNNGSGAFRLLVFFWRTKESGAIAAAC
ncbi:MAG: hypothetical protein MUC94_01085, partial [bacterium]|nr:hypothetical protein [bacterium]